MKLKCPSALFLIGFIPPIHFCFAQLNLKEAFIVGQFGKFLSADLKRANLHGSMSFASIKNNQI